MILSYCKSEFCIDDLLRHAMESGERITKESPVASYEMIGRLFIVFGVVCKTAGELYELEKESRRTLLDLLGGDYERHITNVESQRCALKRMLGRVPLFRERDYQKYPQVEVDDILSVKEEFLPLEQLPFCGNRKAEELNFDATKLAYKMHDMIFLGLEGIIKILQGMYDHQRLLPVKPEMRAKRWQRMMEDYCENQWKDDKRLFEMRREEHIRQYGCDKDSLMELMKQIDNEGTNQLFGGMVATLNWHYLNQDDHVTFIFENRDRLTWEQLTQHLKFIQVHKMQEQEIELYDLRQPAVGACADLFTNRAAQEMVETLAPVIARQVDFRYGYQYGAWVKAMVDLNLIRAGKRNGSAITQVVNRTFGEQIDKTTLFRCLGNDNDFEKIRDLYMSILSVVHQETNRDPRLYSLKRAL